MKTLTEELASLLTALGPLQPQQQNEIKMAFIAGASVMLLNVSDALDRGEIEKAQLYVAENLELADKFLTTILINSKVQN